MAIDTPCFFCSLSDEKGKNLKILDDLFSLIAKNDRPILEVIIGAYQTAVVSRNCGMAATFKEEGHHGEGGVKEAGNILEKSALTVAKYARSHNLLEASLGMAALNSLIDVDENRCVEINAYEILKKKGEGKNIGIVGHFPFVPKLRNYARNLWILEKRPQPGDLPEKETETILSQCEVIGITSTTFTNHTLENLLHLARDRYLVMIGPTTPLTTLLFEYGIDVISGVQVTDKKTALAYISQGATFKKIKGVRRLTMVKNNII